MIAIVLFAVFFKQTLSHSYQFIVEPGQRTCLAEHLVSNHNYLIHYTSATFPEDLEHSSRKLLKVLSAIDHQMQGLTKSRAIKKHPLGDLKFQAIGMDDQ